VGPPPRQAPPRRKLAVAVAVHQSDRAAVVAVSVAQITGAVGFGGARLTVPDDNPDTAPAPLPDLMRRCFAAPDERPTASAIRAALEEALPRTKGHTPRHFVCPLSHEVTRDPVPAEDIEATVRSPRFAKLAL
jgi:hypothetical protein